MPGQSQVSVIVAVDENGVIGTNVPEPKLLWRLPADMKFFKEKTTGHPVIMGRVTYLSIPEKFRPLDAGRTTIVLTKQQGLEYEGCIMATSLEEALDQASMSRGAEEIFIAGGSQIYDESLPLVHRVYLTRVHGSFEGEITFPDLDPTDWVLLSCQEQEADAKHPYAFTWETYERR